MELLGQRCGEAFVLFVAQRLHSDFISLPSAASWEVPVSPHPVLAGVSSGVLIFANLIGEK